MAGHSKWKNILHKKEKTDAQRAKIFTKLSREIIVAVREGGPDISSNSRLKEAVSKAKSANVPNDNINRVISRASGGENVNYESITYEGYGPCGIAVIVETMTDNRNRTASDMRHYFDKYGGNLGASGCVSWSFSKKGVIIIEKEGKDEDKAMIDALDSGAEDFLTDEEVMYIYTMPEELLNVAEKLKGLGYEFLSAEASMVPQNYVGLKSEDDIKNMTKLLELLEDNDDVQNVWHNWEE